MNSRFCSTRIMVRPLLSRRRCSTSTISSMIEGWMPSVGSSSRMRRGLPQRQRASASSCCSPPDSAPPDRSSKRFEARKLLEHFGDGFLLAARLLGAAHAQIVVNREPRKDLAPLRHIAEPQPRALIGLGRRHVAAVETDRPAGRRQKSHQRLEQRRLAHAVMAEDSDELADLDGKAHPVEDRNAAVARAQSLDVEHHAAACLPR